MTPKPNNNRTTMMFVWRTVKESSIRHIMVGPVASDLRAQATIKNTGKPCRAVCMPQCIKKRLGGARISHMGAMVP